MRRLVASLVAIAMAAVTLVAAIETPASAAPASPYDPTWAPTSPVPGVSFSGSADTWVEASDIAVLPDGKVLANMAPSAIAPQPSRLIRYSTTGAADPTFTPIDLGTISASNGTIAIDHQGRILALASGELRRYLPTGLIDATFTPIGVYTGTTPNLPVIFGIAIDAADRVVVSARIRGNDNVQRGYVIRYTSEGAVDTTFGYLGGMQLPMTSARRPVIMPDGRIVVAGVDQSINQPDAPITIVRLLAGGTLDPTFNPGGPVPGVATAQSGVFTDAAAIAVDATGGIVVVGSTLPLPAGCCTPAVAIRVDSTGQLDAAFTAAANPAISTLASVNDIAARPDGRLVLVGRRVDGHEGNGGAGSSRGTAVVALLEANGGPADSFGWPGMGSGVLELPGLTWPDTDMLVTRAALRSDGAIAIAGGAAGDRAAIAMLAAPQALTPEPPPAPAATGNYFNPVGPHRILDTRTGTGAPAGKAQPATPIHLDVTGHHAIPDTGVSAVTINITVNDPDTAGYATIYPCNIATPDASNLNYSAHDTIPNLVTVPVAPDGTICLYTYAPAHVIGDIAGWYGS
jgi:uncharacterized delta-60 repeat protein